MSKKLLKMEKRMSREEISEKLSRIAEGVENGEVKLSSGNDSVNLHPGENPEFELEVEEENDGDISLEIEIEWNPEKEKREDIEIG
ncbi:MAG: amphi-Trp domain-containing protein [Nanohaloarchaea archaeon]|nr:amphi-Trp domain-containing protein [Candidatus Nanohaloarchaea archaeon]